MKLLENIFNKKEKPIKTAKDFWRWFLIKERSFYAVVKSGNNIEELFFNELSPKLDELREGFFFLTGMADSNTAELIITADGNIKNIPFVEDLISEAPQIKNWIFTALKPALDIEDVNITMSGYDFKRSNISFYSVEDMRYPDDIDIRVVYDDFNENDRTNITIGLYIFLDNLLGELNFATTIDNLIIENRANEKIELVPIDKLKSFLVWREKEFIEKYESVRHIGDGDMYSSFDSTTKDGFPIVSMFNTGLLNWEDKASYPWLLKVEIKYDGNRTNGMPDDNTYNLLEKIESQLMTYLGNEHIFLNVGRETGNCVRKIYVACKDFRKAAKAVELITQNYPNMMLIEYDIYKDKYWTTLNRYIL